jgi:hypothetical protein
MEPKDFKTQGLQEPKKENTTAAFEKSMEKISPRFILT